MTETGCNFIIMGFTGRTAGEYKEQFVNAFQAMKKELEVKLPNFKNPIEMAKVWIKQEEEKQALLLENTEMKPDAEFGKSIKTSEGCLTPSDFAKTALNNANVKLGPNKFCKWLRDNGYMFKRKNKNVAYQKYIDRGLFEMKEKAYSNNKKDGVSVQIMITGLGQEYFVNKLKPQEPFINQCTLFSM